jgi:hypothetical protein
MPNASTSATVTRLSGEFEITGWDEATYEERDGGRKLTRASVGQDLRGDMTGSGHAEWLMSYQDDGTARFVGLQRLEGTIDGRTGTVVVESIGDFDGTKAKGRWTVVPGSGTAGWTGMKGKGRFQAPLGPKATFTLDCEFSD